MTTDTVSEPKVFWASLMLKRLVECLLTLLRSLVWLQHTDSVRDHILIWGSHHDSLQSQLIGRMPALTAMAFLGMDLRLGVGLSDHSGIFFYTIPLK